ncbi:hypothetical protein CTP10_R62720 (plasmid) [Cupriavidus sp. P-10]|uniref:c-type cytochrome n=1 Tax=Cupriavidus sp. P-10 TaxID=2027911 RepID=UPI001F28B452|nr:hypothetical protein CTP10_R62720 [Cupriavidus sp. P-10]
MTKIWVPDGSPPQSRASFDRVSHHIPASPIEIWVGVSPYLPASAAFADANSVLHPSADSMAEPETPSYASRSATKPYRTTPLRGIWQHAPYFHDGSAATLSDVVKTYNTKQGLGLTNQEIADLAEYLKSL